MLYPPSSFAPNNDPLTLFWMGGEVVVAWGGGGGCWRGGGGGSGIRGSGRGVNFREGIIKIVVLKCLGWFHSSAERSAAL